MTERSPEAQASLDALSMHLFGRKQTEGECVMCGSKKMGHDDFKDDLSRKEAKITYQCQSCQDETEAAWKEAEEE